MRPFLALLLLTVCAIADVLVPPGDTAELTRAIAVPGETVHLAAGVYDIAGQVVPGDHAKLVGAGMGLTILRRVKSAAMFAVVQNEMQSSSDVVVSDLTIDCNDTSAFGVILFGDRCTVRDVHVLNHVSPMNGSTQQESFAILVTNGNNSAGERIDSYGGLIENCRVTDFHGNYDGGIVVAGWPPPRFAYGTVRNCTFIGSGVAAPGFDFSGIIGAQVTENNTVQGAAIGTYIEGGGWGHMILRNNRYLNCRMGVRVAMSYGFTLENLVIQDNYFEVPEGKLGIVITSDNAMRRVSISENRFVKLGKAGAWCSLTNVPFLTLAGNIWDVPLTATVSNSGGSIGDNVTSDGQFRTRAVWIKKPKPANALKVLQAD